MDPTVRQGHARGHSYSEGQLAAGVVLAMVGLIPLAMHATGAGYVAQGLIAVAVGIAVAIHGANRQRRAAERADRDRAYAQFRSVRSSPFDVRRTADLNEHRHRVVVSSFRVDLPEFNAAELNPAEIRSPR